MIMWTRLFQVGLVALTAVPMLGMLGCDKFDTPPPPPFDLIVHVESDPGHGVPGAAVVRNGKTLSSTAADGRAQVRLTGNEGDTVEVFVKCSDDFQSPAKPILLALHRMTDKSKLPEYNAACPPSVRRVVVAIRAENGANLPVTYLGKAVGRTDASGAAHVLLAMHPGDQFELALDTTNDPRLSPTNPNALFVVKPKDDIQAFDVKFTVAKPKPIPKKKIDRPHEIKSHATFPTY
jgi:hypothetical protein